MNLEDVIDTEYGLQQDDWSLSKPTFGEEGQLEVVGWSGKHRYAKYYILKCETCSKDMKLFGGGYFRSLKGGLTKGQTPCGCAFNPKWNKDQYHTLCSRKAKELGYTFLGFESEWKGKNTKLKMYCTSHGTWNSGGISNLINLSQGCPTCRIDTVKICNTKPDDLMLASFFASGAFHPDTKFWRSDRKNSMGWGVYWYMSCPECGETGESSGSDLRKGKRPCCCSKHRQQEAYVNWVLENNSIIAIKFGIANVAVNRVKQQNRIAICDVVSHLTYTFPDTLSCKKAERECKQVFTCGIIPKDGMPDGYTETTFIYNLDKIKQIYTSYGGVCTYNSEDNI